MADLLFEDRWLHLFATTTKNQKFNLIKKNLTKLMISVLDLFR